MITLLGSVGVGGNSTTATTAALDTTGADFILISMSTYQGAQINIDNYLNTYTPLTEYPVVNGTSSVQFFYCLDPIVGPGHVIQGTGPGSATFPAMTVTWWNGVDAFDVENGASTLSSVTTLGSGNVTPSQSNALVVSALCLSDSSTAITEGSALSIEETVSGALGVNMVGSLAYEIQGSATTRAASWSWTTGSAAATAIAVFTSGPIRLDPGAYTLTGSDMTSLGVETGLRVFISNVDKSSLVRQGGLRLNYALGSNWTADFPVQDTDSTASAYRPDLDEEVLTTYFGQRIHKGHIVTIRNGPLAASSVGAMTQVLSKANRISTDQIEVTAEYEAGQTVDVIVTDLFDTYIAPNFTGYVLDPAMLTGPVISETVTFEATRLQEAFNRLTDLTGWIIRLTPDDVFECFEPGTKSAAFALTAANGLAELVGSGSVRPVVTWEKSRSTFVNRVNLKYGSGTASVTETIPANGTDYSFDLAYEYVSDFETVDNDGTPEIATRQGIGFDLAVQWLFYPPAALGDPWTLRRETTGVADPPAAGTITVTYVAQFPEIVTVEDAVSIAAVGLFERTFTAPTVFDADEAAELAAGHLRVNSSAPKIITVNTLQYPMPLPGDVINLDYPDLLIDDEDYLITQVSAYDYNPDALAFTFTCVEGTEIKRNWTDLLRSALGVSN
jgi:hypothetical protein